MYLLSDDSDGPPKEEAASSLGSCIGRAPLSSVNGDLPIHNSSQGGEGEGFPPGETCSGWGTGERARIQLLQFPH